jgi:alkylation response protein AidB-like acyl-CoA dehydrogenase
MRLELPSEYYEFSASIERYLLNEWKPQQVRQYWEAGSGVAGGDTLWRGLAEAGLFGLVVPEACGGDGLSSLSAALVVEQAGRMCVPHPVAETVMVAAPMLEEDGSAQAHQWLRDIASGNVKATVQDGWNGFAPWAADCDLVLVVVGDDLVSYCSRADESTRATSSDPARRLARAQPAQVIATTAHPGVGARARLRATVATAIQLGGLSRRVVELSVEYARVRRQFGQPIGAFQAVKHMLADAHFAVETARRYPWVALEAIDTGKADMVEAASVAKLTMGEAATTASYAGLQVHGGIGYTWECDLHFWLKRIQVLTNSFGTPEFHANVLAATYYSAGSELVANV